MLLLLLHSSWLVRTAIIQTQAPGKPRNPQPRTENPNLLPRHFRQRPFRLFRLFRNWVQLQDRLILRLRLVELSQLPRGFSQRKVAIRVIRLILHRILRALIRALVVPIVLIELSDRQVLRRPRFRSLRSHFRQLLPPADWNLGRIPAAPLVCQWPRIIRCVIWRTRPTARAERAAEPIILRRLPRKPLRLTRLLSRSRRTSRSISWKRLRLSRFLRLRRRGRRSIRIGRHRLIRPPIRGSRRHRRILARKRVLIRRTLRRRRILRGHTVLHSRSQTRRRRIRLLILRSRLPPRPHTQHHRQRCRANRPDPTCTHHLH